MDRTMIEKIKANMKRDCKNNFACVINFQGIMNPADNAMAKYCDDEAFFYIQAPCILPSQQIKERRIIGLFVACVTVFTVFFSMTYIEYIKSVQQFKYVDFDFKTLTAADYTMEFTITKKMWQHFLDNFLDKDSIIPDIG